MKRIYAVLTLLSLILILFGIWFHREYKTIAEEPVTAWTEDQRGDCAIVLTGGPGRVREGFDLLAQGQVRKLIISGTHPKATLREIFPQWPYYGNLRAEDVVLEHRSATTYGNAQQSLPLVEALRCRSLVLVTSHIHMRRALKTFRRAFPGETMIQERAVSSGSIPPRTWDLVVETFKSLFYSLWAY